MRFSGDRIPHIPDFLSLGEVGGFVERLNGQFGVGQFGSVDVVVAVQQPAARVCGDGIEGKLVKIRVVVFEVYEAAGAEDCAGIFREKKPT